MDIKQTPRLRSPAPSDHLIYFSPKRATPVYHSTRQHVATVSPSMAFRSVGASETSTDENRGDNVDAAAESTGATAESPILRTSGGAAGWRQACFSDIKQTSFRVRGGRGGGRGREAEGVVVMKHRSLTGLRLASQVPRRVLRRR